MERFESDTPTGALILAALRMYQQSDGVDRLAFDDILTNGGKHKFPSAAFIDSVCDDFRDGRLVAVSQTLASPAIVQRARDDWQTDELEIDDNPVISPGDDGCFVSAWVWVPDKGYHVTVEAKGIQITADNLVHARKLAQEDAEQFKSEWNYEEPYVGEYEFAPDIEESPTAELDLTARDGELFTFNAVWSFMVKAETEEEAKARVLEIIKDSQPSLPNDVEREGPAALVIDALNCLETVERAECFDGAESGFFVLDDGREFRVIVEETYKQED